MVTTPKILFTANAIFQILEDPSNLDMDDIYREPVESGEDIYVQGNGSPVQLSIPCQWVPMDDERVKPVAGGDSPSSIGYIVVGRKDMRNIFKDYNNEIKVGDLLVSVGGESVGARVLAVEAHSHYGGLPRLYFIRYEDQQQGID